MMDRSSGYHCCPGLLIPLTLLFSGSFAAGESGKPFDPFLAKHCLSCHDAKTHEGGLDLQKLDSEFIDSEAIRRWTRVYDRIADGEMPPKQVARPPMASKGSFLKSLGQRIATGDRSIRTSGLRRLNRVEYENTVCDLFQVRIDLKNSLPVDATGQGFDTVGDALGISSEHTQAYLQATEKILDAIYGADREPPRVSVKMPLGRDEFAARTVGDLFLKDADDSLTLFQGNYCPSIFLSGRAKVEGTYRVTIKARTYQSNHPLIMCVKGGDVVIGRGPVHLVGYYDVGLGDEWTTVTFEDVLQEYDCYLITPYRLHAPTQGPDRFKGPGLTIGEVAVEGPIEAWPPPSREKLIGKIDLKSAGTAEAREIFARLLPRAFRRRTNADEIEPFLALTQVALDARRSFRDALNVGLKAILCSPEFLMREESTAEHDPANVSTESLASRLAYFLWSSMPDDELLTLAASGTLSQPAILRQQVERMLHDPKSQRFVENFAGQWLGLRDIDFTVPDARLYPEFDEMLRYTIVEETRRFFKEVLDHDEPLLDFVDSNWAVLNERLAIHYEIRGVTGMNFRRVELPSTSVRGGVMTHASVLKVTANGTNTSPVIRGNWILSNIMGRPSLPPPANIPQIEPDIRSAKTIRERLARHRDIESCAVCHDRIDPPGLAMESFDAIGGFRRNYRTLGPGTPVNLEIDRKRVQFKSGAKVDPSSQLPDGRGFADVRRFKQLLREDKEQFAKCLTEKLLTYALGRRLGFADRSAVNSIVQNVSQKKYGFRSLIHEIVQSEAFHER